MNDPRIAVERLYPIWCWTLHSGSSGKRANVLGTIEEQSNLIFRLGGSEAVEECDSAIEDVTQWWP